MSRKEDLLRDLADHVLAHGIGELALRPLAAAAGTNARMLIYHFGAKDDLVDALLEECRRRRAESLESCPRESFLAVWSHLSSRRGEPHMRLAVEIEALAAQGRKEFLREARRIGSEWLTLFGGRGKPRATAAAAACRGLLLDLYASGDRARANAAAHEISALFGQRAKP